MEMVATTFSAAPVFQVSMPYRYSREAAAPSDVSDTTCMNISPVEDTTWPVFDKVYTAVWASCQSQITGHQPLSKERVGVLEQQSRLIFQMASTYLMIENL